MEGENLGREFREKFNKAQNFLRTQEIFYSPFSQMVRDELLHKNFPNSPFIKGLVLEEICQELKHNGLVVYTVTTSFIQNIYDCANSPTFLSRSAKFSELFTSPEFTHVVGGYHVVIFPLVLDRKRGITGWYIYLPAALEGVKLIPNAEIDYPQYDVIDELLKFHAKDLKLSAIFTSHKVYVLGTKIKNCIASLSALAAIFRDESTFCKRTAQLTCLASISKDINIILAKNQVDEFRYLSFKNLICQYIFQNRTANEPWLCLDFDESKEGKNGDISNERDAPVDNSNPIPGPSNPPLNLGPSNPPPPALPPANPSPNLMARPDEGILNNLIRNAHTLEKAIRICKMDEPGADPWDILRGVIKDDPSIITYWAQEQAQFRLRFFRNRGNYARFKKILDSLFIGMPRIFIGSVPKRKKRQNCTCLQCKSTRFEIGRQLNLGQMNLNNNEMGGMGGEQSAHLATCRCTQCQGVYNQQYGYPPAVQTNQQMYPVSPQPPLPPHPQPPQPPHPQPPQPPQLLQPQSAAQQQHLQHQQYEQQEAEDFSNLHSSQQYFSRE